MMDPIARNAAPTGAHGVVRSGPPLPAATRRTGSDTVLAAILVAGAFAVVLAGVRSVLYDLERYLVPKELALHASALACLVVLLPRWRRVELSIAESLLAAFFSWTAISAALAINSWFALRGAGVTFSAFVLFLAARELARRGLGGAVLAGVTAAATAGGLLGVFQAYGADWPLLAESRPPGGTFGNRNFLAHLMAITLPVLLLLAVRARRWPALLGYLGGAIAASAIVLTRSRAAWLAAAAALAVFGLAVFMSRRHTRAGLKRRRLVLTATLLGVGVAASIVLPNRLEWRAESPYAETFARLANYREGSGRGRLIQYRNSLAMVRSDPVFGVGPGNWFVHYPRVTTPGDPSFAGADPIPTNPWPSSDWVALLAERGAVAVLFALLAGGTATMTAVRRLDSEDHVAAPAALLGVLTATLVTGAFDAVLMLPPPAFFVAVFVGILLPETRPVIERGMTARVRRAGSLAAFALSAVLVAASSAQLAAILIASADDRRATYERAVRFYPGDHRLQLVLARRGACAVRLPHARAAAGLMPFHDAPRRALRACGERAARD